MYLKKKKSKTCPKIIMPFRYEVNANVFKKQGHAAKI